LTLVLTYHAVERGPEPLCIAPEVFSQHMAAIARSGVAVLTVRELAAALRRQEPPRNAIAITFDDGFASVAEEAAPVMREHGLRGTVFCVAGHIGGTNDWASQAPWAPRLRLAAADALAQLADEGWELGSHGVEHAPLSGADADLARSEVVDSRRRLEEALGVEVSTYAWPYGAKPSRATDRLIADTYDAACAAGPAAVRSSSDPYALPRVDVYYLRRPERLRRALESEPSFELSLRRAAAGLRRRFRPDYTTSSR
jgi:peptidoglycan/xylan/chitin deacetylase (PgdA/CDA1 family)